MRRSLVAARMKQVLLLSQSLFLTIIEADKRFCRLSNGNCNGATHSILALLLSQKAVLHHYYRS